MCVFKVNMSMKARVLTFSICIHTPPHKNTATLHTHATHVVHASPHTNTHTHRAHRTPIQTQHPQQTDRTSRKHTPPRHDRHRHWQADTDRQNRETDRDTTVFAVKMRIKQVSSLLFRVGFSFRRSDNETKFCLHNCLHP